MRRREERRRERRDDRGDHDPPEGLRRPERPAQGGPPARPGSGRLLRRHQAAQHGLRPLRPLALRARARSTSIDVSAALELPGVYGTLTGDEVAILTDPFFQIAADPAGTSRTTRSPSGRCASSASPSPPSSPRRASSRATPPSSSMVEYEPLDVVVDARQGARRRRARAPRGVRRQHVLHGRLGVGRRRRGLRRGRSRRHDRRAPLRPLQLDAARARRRARRVQPRHRAVDDLHEQPVPGLRGDHDGARDAGRDRQAAHGHAGHRRRLRQQDHLAPAARRVLPARAQAQPPDPVDRVAHRVPPVDVARQRALVPRHRGRGQGRRHDARLPHEGARRRRRLPALRAARRRDLVAGRARHVRLAQHPRRVHAGDDEQGAGVAEPRLLAHAAPLADRADRSTSSPPSSASTPSRSASATTSSPSRCRTRRRTAASTTRATTRARSTSRSS